MDDLWGNAWSQADEDVAGKAVRTLKSLEDAPWKPAATSTKVEEADIGLPSWSTGAINWAEPTGEVSLWTSEVATDGLSVTTHATGWGGETELNYGIGDTAANSEDGERLETPVETERLDDELEDGPEMSDRPSESTPVVEYKTLAPEAVAEVHPHSHGDDTLKSSELFGSFETGLELRPGVSAFEDDDKWETPLSTDDAWGSRWENPDAEEEQDEAPRDEWEIAREEKLRRDRAVPPELMQSILALLNELPSDLWPAYPKSDHDPELGNWRDGMDNVTGLNELVRQALPGIAVPPPIQFSHSHIAKALAKSVKLSKNLPVVRQSPMSHLFTAKSSTAWELSVKSKVETPKDDIPTGWRTVDNEPLDTKEQKPQLPEKKSSGFLAFLGRRSSTVPVINASAATQNSVRSASPAPSKASASGAASTRTSVDVQSPAEPIQSSLSLSSIPSDTPAPPIASSASLPSSLSSLPPSEAVSPSIGQPAPEPSMASPPAPTAAPSAVSRFFNRFSRAASSSRRSSSSPRSSIALSTDDIEFLSDIVPSHDDDMDEDDQLSALTAMVSSPATLNLPNKLPPPLAPPPRRTSLAQAPVLQQPSASKPSSIFNDFDAFSAPSGSSSTSALPPPLPPPISPTSFTSLSKPATPSPLGSNHIRTSSKSSIPGIASPPSRTRTPISPPLVGLGTWTIPQANVVESSPVLQALNLPSVLPPASVKTQPVFSDSSQPIRSSSAGLVTPTIPPPVEKSPGRIYSLSNTKPSNDDDEFSFFHSSPSILFGSTQAISTVGSASTSGVFTDKSTLSRHDVSEENDFGDFGDFISTVSPVTLPPLPQAVPPPPPKKHVPANIQTHIRKPSAADRQAAADLVEKAAARKGRWPAPPSPIPERLPPPPSMTSVRSISPPGSSITLRPIAQITSISRSSTPMNETTSGSRTTPTLLPPPLISGLPSSHTPSLLDLGSSSPRAPFTNFSQSIKPLPKPAAPSSETGLSAQDLSFFEGL